MWSGVRAHARLCIGYCARGIVVCMRTCGVVAFRLAGCSVPGCSHTISQLSLNIMTAELIEHIRLDQEKCRHHISSFPLGEREEIRATQFNVMKQRIASLTTVLQEVHVVKLMTAIKDGPWTATQLSLIHI